MCYAKYELLDIREPQGWDLADRDALAPITEVRLDRPSLVSGPFYGVEGMRVGGTRRLEIGPHLTYGDRGVPGVNPAVAVLIAEITILNACASTPAPRSH